MRTWVQLPSPPPIFAYVGFTMKLGYGYDWLSPAQGGEDCPS